MEVMGPTLGAIRSAVGDTTMKEAMDRLKDAQPLALGKILVSPFLPRPGARLMRTVIHDFARTPTASSALVLAVIRVGLQWAVARGCMAMVMPPLGVGHGGISAWEFGVSLGIVYGSPETLDEGRTLTVVAADQSELDHVVMGFNQSEAVGLLNQIPPGELH